MSTPQVWLPDVEWFAIQQERVRHDQALYRVGEYGIFVLMWTIRDLEAGLVARCDTCDARTSTLITETYHQASSDTCPDCFGTTFDGGYKAILVRPSIWTWTETTVEQDRKGDIERSHGAVDTTSDFRCQPKDYIFRGDGNRYKIQAVDGVHLNTGFGVQSHNSNAVNYTYQVVRINPSDPGYLIPPDQNTLVSVLIQDYARYPVDFSGIEALRGSNPVIVQGTTVMPSGGAMNDGVPQKVTELLSSPSAGTYTITHNLGTSAVVVSAIDQTTRLNVDITWEVINDNVVDVIFDSSASNNILIVIVG